MALYDTGYDDELFQHPVGHTLHCNICTNVLKDPVMCRHNEHLYCRACITPHLVNFQTCPNCMDPLTVDTLCQASRGIRNLLAELKIRCKFFDRGCGTFVELGQLESHIGECGFAPAVCSNDGCQLEVNKRDLLHHETTECEHRRVQCHSCSDIKNEIDRIKVSLVAMDEKLERNETELGEKLETVEANVETVEENVVALTELVQEHLDEQHECNRRLQADNEEIKKSLNAITHQLQTITRTLSEVQAEQMKKGIAEADGIDREPKVIIAGGKNENGCLDSVEMFSVSTRTWTPLQPLKQCPMGASSAVYNSHVFVIGGHISFCGTKSIQTLSLNAIQTDQSVAWENSPAKLPFELWGHCAVVYNGRLIVIGGYDGDKSECSDNITDVSLVPPYTSKLLTTMPQKRWYHGVALFGDKILIVGGGQGKEFGTNTKTVLLYDITKNECQELAPLPYAVSEMALVKWRSDNAVIIGGVDDRSNVLKTVLLYNIKTQKSHMLPDLPNKRKGCAAAVFKDTVIVMGGKDEEEKFLKSVESFRFDSYSWEEVPEMHEKKYHATALCVDYPL